MSSTGSSRRRSAAPLLLTGPALLLGIVSGLSRIGLLQLQIPFVDAERNALGAAHAALMILGFLAALISFERARSAGRRWMLMLPLVASGAALASIYWPAALGVGGLIVGVGLAASALLEAMKAGRPAAIAQLGAAVLLSIGSARSLQQAPIADWIAAWLGFVLLSIVGDRLLLHSPRQSRGDRAWHAAALSLVTVPAAAGSSWGATPRLWPLALAALSVASWMLLRDREGMSFHLPDLKRYHAVLRLLGSIWLVAFAVALWVLPIQAAGLYYDATLHLFLTGFVLSFVFAHGPVVFAGLFDRLPRWNRGLWLPALLLQFANLVRLVGDLELSSEWRQVGGLLTALALLLFLVVTHLPRGAAEAGRGEVSSST